MLYPRVKKFIIGCALIAFPITLQSFPTNSRNDQYPFFSSYNPYSFLTTRQKANLMNFDYTYVENRFRTSVSGFQQHANCGKNSEGSTINLGDIDGRWNIFGLFYDPKLRRVLFDALGITPANFPTGNDDICLDLVTDPRYVDLRKEFGFLTVPLKYRKYGVRFESEILLVDRCFYGIGLRVQWGIADVRQTATMQYPNVGGDLTCQALGVACPAAPRKVYDNVITRPEAADPTGITPPFVDPTEQPRIGRPLCAPLREEECVPQIQPFRPRNTETVSLSFSGACKQFVEENILSQRDTLAKILDLDICNYHKTGLDDLYISLYWRHLYIMNEDLEYYPRVNFMPFAEGGIGIPMAQEVHNNTKFAVPFGSNGHASIVGRAGFTIDFPDTIDLTASAGFSFFVKRDYCNYRMPTNFAESGIFPYSADVTLRPGPTWYGTIGMNAHRFLGNLSFWGEYCMVSHAEDEIKLCRSFIPEGSIYFTTGFDIKRAECLSKWESHFINVGFNYDLTPSFSAGLLLQIPIKQRNSYRSQTVLGSIHFVY
ncbi:hypothetical protein H0X06_01280 [Candidatus Dependentiae bacterium]|nr:hypothetical protein [Candidatus Dependentiae bacterium]